MANIDPRQAANEVISLAQWVLTTLCGILLLALLCSSLLAKFGLPNLRLPTAPPLDLMYYGIAWVCYTGMIGALFKR